MLAILVGVVFAQEAVDGESPRANAQLFRPTIDGERTLWTDDTTRAEDRQAQVRTLLHYANRPVLYRTGDGEAVDVVRDIAQLSLLGAYTVGRVRLGVDVPLYLRTGGVAGGETGLGDMALDVRGSLLERQDAPVGLALAARLTVPTATVQGALGNRGFGYDLEAIVDRDFGDLRLAANVGTRGIPRAELENFVWDDRLVFRLGGGYALTEDAGLSLDIGTGLNYAQISAVTTPAEGILGGYGRIGELVLRGGVGTGLSRGFGAPRLRLIAGLSWSPSTALDTDGDGLVDELDMCPTEREDLDGFLDEDGCPEPTEVRVAVRDMEGQPLEEATWTVTGPVDSSGNSGGDLRLEPGAYTFVASAPRYQAGEPMTVGITDGEPNEVVLLLEPMEFVTTLAAWISGPEGEIIRGATWTAQQLDGPPVVVGVAVDIQPGTYTIRAEAEGYRPQTREVVVEEGSEEVLNFQLAVAKVEIVEDVIDIQESVYFETGKAVIKAESFALLDEVAQILVEHPELSRIRIEGHTDSRGSASYNLKLSKRRASAVVAYLIGKDVAAERLESDGYGETRPINPSNTEQAWTENRRVDFYVVDRAE